MIPFDFKGNRCRTLLRSGEPWFVAKDVGETLGIRNVRRSLANFPENEKGVTTIFTPAVTSSYGRGEQRASPLGGFPEKEKGVTDIFPAVSNNDGRGQGRTVAIINEPGLYRLIFQSRKAEAEEFKAWVFTEVLPALRKTGTYTASGKDSPLPDAAMLKELRLLWEKKAVSVKELRLFLGLNPDDAPAGFPGKTARAASPREEVPEITAFVRRNIEFTQNTGDDIVSTRALYNLFLARTRAETVSQVMFTKRFRRMFAGLAVYTTARVNGVLTKCFRGIKIKPEGA